MTESSQEKRIGEIHEWYLYKKRETQSIPPKRARLILLYPDQPSSPIHTHNAGAKATQTPTPTSAIQLPARLLSPQKSCIVSRL